MIKDKNVNIPQNVPNININNNTNNININNNTNNSGNNNYNINLNQSGIGPTKKIIDFNPVNLPKNKKENKNEEYEKLAQKKNALLDLMNKMNFDKLNYNDDHKNKENNRKEENKNENNVVLEPEKENEIKAFSPEEDIDKKNKFDDRLLESQAFEPEKIQKIVMDDIPGPDDTNFGQDIVNPYDINDIDNKNSARKKDNFNFEPSSPIENKQLNFERPINLSLASEIKKIDEDNPYPDFEGKKENFSNKNTKMNDSNAFNFEYERDKQNEKKENKDLDTFNFNTNDNQKEGDEWDF
jgi:hypothetical protein